MQEPPQPNNIKQEVRFQIPGCTVHVMGEGDAQEFANGEFTVVKLADDNLSLATIIKVGGAQWPLTKDEPVVKLDSCHYLFTLPMKDGDPLSYGVTFHQKYVSSLDSLDSFLKENACLCSGSGTSTSKEIDWKEFAAKMQGYNAVLKQASAGETGQIVEGIFKLNDNYAIQVLKGGEEILTRTTEEQSLVTAGENRSNRNAAGAEKKGVVTETLKRIRQLSAMAEKLSKTVLDIIETRPESQEGKAFLSMAPGEILLVSLDLLGKVLVAAEANEKQSFAELVGAEVSKRHGQSAGEVTEDVVATAEHCCCACWNIFKIKKTIEKHKNSESSRARRNAAG